MVAVSAGFKPLNLWLWVICTTTALLLLPLTEATLDGKKIADREALSYPPLPSSSIESAIRKSLKADFQEVGYITLFVCLPFLSLTHTNTHTHTQTHKHTYTIFWLWNFSLSLSLSLSHTHTLSLSHSDIFLRISISLNPFSLSPSICPLSHALTCSHTIFLSLKISHSLSL